MNARDLLKFLMSRAGDNPNSLAAKAKVPQPTLYRFLSGTAKEPRLSTFEPVAKHYGIPVEAFFSEAVRDEVAHAVREANDVLVGGLRFSFFGHIRIIWHRAIEKYNGYEPCIFAIQNGSLPYHWSMALSHSNGEPT